MIQNILDMAIGECLEESKLALKAGIPKQKSMHHCTLFVRKKQYCQKDS